MSANRVLSCPIPENLNPLSPNGFMLSIEKLPQLTYFSQEIAVPSVSLREEEILTPLSRISIPSDVLDFSSLDVTFLVDEKMENYKAIYDWMKGLGFPESYDEMRAFLASSNRQTSSTLSKYYSDGVVMVLGNSGKSIQNIRYIDMYPISLSALTFSSTNSDVQYLVGTASFSYTYYKFE